MLSQWLVLPITKKVISSDLFFLEHQPFVALQTQNLHYKVFQDILKSLETFLF